jgi:polyphosphate kinase
VTDQGVKMAKAEEKRSRGRRALFENGRRDESGAKARRPVVNTDNAELPPLEPEMFINRELSWLDFNNRVLFEAEESRNPLLDRVKFAAIFAVNLDEFFMIRVAGIKRKVDAGIDVRGPDGRTPVEQIAAV